MCLRRFFSAVMLLAAMLCAQSLGVTAAQEYEVANFGDSGQPSRTGLPALPESWQPHNWLHPSPSDPARSTGIGSPLKGTSWRNRPFYIGWMFGDLIGDTLIDQRVDQGDGLFGGYRLGWDFDHYWGTELRFAFAEPELVDVQGGLPLASATDKFWDVNLLYYPWGDATWRPYASVGLGFGHFRFVDTTSTLFDDYLFTIPIGFGVKHYYRPWLALRAGVEDNLAFASQGIDTMHNLSVSCGVEVHFGGPRQTYYPYHAGGIIW